VIQPLIVTGSAVYDQSAIAIVPSAPAAVSRGTVATKTRPAATRTRVTTELKVSSPTIAPLAGSILSTRASSPPRLPSVTANSQVPSVASCAIWCDSTKGAAAVHGSTWYESRSMDASPSRATPPAVLRLPPSTTPSGAGATAAMDPTTSGANGSVAADPTS
jgi:hypothetical protein